MTRPMLAAELVAALSRHQGADPVFIRIGDTAHPVTCPPRLERVYKYIDDHGKPYYSTLPTCGLDPPVCSQVVVVVDVEK